MNYYYYYYDYAYYNDSCIVYRANFQEELPSKCPLLGACDPLMSRQRRQSPMHGFRENIA